MCEAATGWAGAAASAEAAYLASNVAANSVDRHTPFAADVLRVAARINCDIGNVLSAASRKEINPEELKKRIAEIAEAATISLRQLDAQ